MDRYFIYPDCRDSMSLLIHSLAYLCLAITAKIIVGIIRENYEPCAQLAQKIRGGFKS